jgi:hypothetical protein
MAVSLSPLCSSCPFPQEDSWYSFLLQTESTPGPSVAQRNMWSCVYESTEKVLCQVKLFLCLIKCHMKKNWDEAPWTLKLSTKVEIYGQLHALSCFNPGYGLPTTCCRGGWLCSRASMDAVKKRKISASAWKKTQISQSSRAQCSHYNDWGILGLCIKYVSYLQ